MKLKVLVFSIFFIFVGFMNLAFSADYAFVNLQKALNESEAGQKAKAVLKNHAKELENILNEKQEYLKRLKNSNPNPEFFNSEVEKFKKLFNEDNDSLNDLKAQMEGFILDGLRTTVAEIFNRGKKYNLIYETGGDTGEKIIIAQRGGINDKRFNGTGGDDLTERVIEEFNKKRELLSAITYESPYFNPKNAKKSAIASSTPNPARTYIPKPDAPEPAEDIREIPDFKSKPREHDLAVVIGIENYQGLPKSDFSKSDAGIVKDYIKALGFRERNIEFLTDEKATFTGIKKTVESWLPNHVKKDSTVFVYYSGHGAPDPKNGDGYMVPFDGDPNYLSDTGYSLRRLAESLGRLEAKEVIVLLDSCFSGAGGRSVLAKGARPIMLKNEGLVLKENMAMISATQGDQISTSSPEKGHGVFTYYFLKALKDGKKSLAEFYEYIKPQIEDEAKGLNVEQTPSINPSTERLKGRFGLVR